MPPLEDITLTVLSQRNFQSNVPARNEQRNAQQQDDFTTLETNIFNTISRGNLPQYSNQRREIASVTTSETNTRLSYSQDIIPSPTSPRTFESSISTHFDLLNISAPAQNSSEEDDDVFNCKCKQFQTSSKSKKRHSLPPPSTGKVNSSKKIKIRRKTLGDGDVLVERLKKIIYNVNKTPPNRTFALHCDAVNFKRVEIYILELKDECFLQCRRLFESANWKILVKYILDAIQIISKLPTWDNNSHNLHKVQLLNVLCTYCQKCVLLGNFEDSYLIEMMNSIQELQNSGNFKTKMINFLSNR